jgi:putative ABC transport system permease protein
VAAGVRRVVGASTQVTDIETSRRVVGSNLTAVELSGLTRVELALALVLCAAASGLTLALGLRERRQMFAVIAALGARRRQLDALVWSESAFVTAGGLLAGGAIAVVLTHMLVKILTGVFDPPPDRLAVPWPYLLAGLAVVLAAVGTAAQLALASLRRPRIEDLRDT